MDVSACVKSYSVTRTHFETLVSGLENGLSDVNTCESSSSNAVSSENLPKTSKGKSKKGKKKNKGGIWACNNYNVTRTHFETLVSGLENGLSDVNTCESSSSNAVSSENLPKTSKGKSKKGKKKNKGGIWACNNCKYENSIDVYSCEICKAPRDAH
ncbi:E3 ubiquitin-protein ligase ARI7 [Artemisia annua]|uniref:E3 ubiquitin-protein ligase ARI7 n=1 Tax=Artemisia annua TaxID=35608 RepID=A0A2U1KLK6_ARTAN|nr:E3 ubiquitin-protein ligase ARI7 [Artemisia annua]